MAAADIVQDITPEVAEEFGLVDHEAAARRLGLTSRSLTVIRSSGNGPLAVRLARGVFYRVSDLDAYEARRAAHRRGRNRADRSPEPAV